ncbi:MAG: HAMP domain-containing histidine kinase [Clostridia bacterium]|nr:HAMP domain-containing histidine kinase [Clostridia bacterium]
MRLLRNPEVRYPLLALLAAAGLSLGLAALLLKGEPYRGTVLAAVGGAFALCGVILLTASLFHSRKVRDFTAKARGSLRGSRDLKFDDFSEGDFSDLQNVVEKMAISHVLQEEQLQKEKNILKDSLENISHQLKTPLQALTTTGEQLMADEMTPAVRKRAARRILDTTDRFSELVKTLLELSKLDAGAEIFRQDTFTARELIDRVCETLEIIMELREIELIKSVPPEITIRSDMKLLSQALINIVKNCMEHTPAGGTVTIAVSDDEVATQIRISDTGPGIDPEDLSGQKLFERFHRGKNAGPNSVGIGLAFTKQVIKGLDDKNEVWAENRPEGGAMFTVRLKKVNV